MPQAHTKASPTLLRSPVMTRKFFAECSGLRLPQIRSQISIDNLPEFPVGRHKMINVAGIVNFPAHILYVPTATAEQFGAWCGLTADQVSYQLSERTLPVKHMGRLRLVDVAELYNRCLEAAGLPTPNA